MSYASTPTHRAGATAGATIEGSVNAGSALPTLTGLTGAGISVEATSGAFFASVVTDGAGRFTISGIPAGDVTLRYTATGLDASHVLPAVGDNELVRIAVTVSSDTVTIESEQRSTPDNRVDLEGPISDISLAIRVVTLAGVVVGVPTDDIIHRGTEQLTLADLQIGDVARVLGVPDGGMVQAVDIEILSPPRAAILTLAGEVSALSGGCPFLMFGVAGTPVETSGATLFRAALCTDLVEGGSVAVSGELSGGVLHAADVLIETDTIQGVVTGLSGSCPTASFTLDGTTVTTDSATQYVGGACADVREGSEVIVAGVLVGGPRCARRRSR